MFIVMHCMGLPFNGDTIKEGSLGGSETAAYYMARELSAQGHKVTLFTGSQDEGNFDGVRYLNYGRPDESAPLGDRFHFYAENTPHDALIIQRHPKAFCFPFAAKVKLWWLHDLAVVRTAPEVQEQLWNVTGVLTVSEFHRQQVCEVYGFDPDKVHAIQNGVDLDLFTRDFNAEPFYPLPTKSDRINLLYTSRPERGLQHLVGPGGLMERLADDDRFHLYVCGYENTTEQMAPYYKQLAASVETLPNATSLGSLTKQELADVMRQCDALVYPTPGPTQPGFEEVSCITAMECMAAGLPFISSKAGALPETCADTGAVLLGLRNGMPDVRAFEKKLRWMFDADNAHAPYIRKLRDKQLDAAKRFAWSFAAGQVDSILHELFAQAKTCEGTVLKEMIRVSDAYAARKYEARLSGVPLDPVAMTCQQELDECYRFAWDDNWKAHYEKVYAREADRGVDYGPERLEGNNRFEHVAGIISNFPDDILVCDYGCAHGHYTVNLAKRFPNKRFVGIDIEETNIHKAQKWAQDDGVENVGFMCGHVNADGVVQVKGLPGETITLDPNVTRWDCVIAAEVMEHVGDPQHLVDTLASYLVDMGVMILTTPFGPWEAQGYDEHWPWRAHVHHFERADLHDMFLHHPDFGVAVAPSGRSRYGDVLGSYITTYGKPSEPSGQIDYDRKYSLLAPQQTVSLCMIVCNEEETLLRALNSAAGVVDEVILAVDPKTSDSTRDVIEQFKRSRNGFWPVVHVIQGEDPLEVGFDEARNHSIDEASCDWVLWMDADEVLTHADNMLKYLHDNMFDGYSIAQHHFSVQPLGVMKTDLPVRLFRNRRGVRFFGVVHEHPETELNAGVGRVTILRDVEIAHHGYTTEAVRRGRFERNIGLMVRDREKHPDRHLGKFLWIRDLAQMCQYELERNGGRITAEMHKRADEGLRIWEELLDDRQTRMLVDGLQFYSVLSQIRGGGFEFAFSLDASKMNGGTHLEQAKPIKAHFASREHLDRLFNALTNERVSSYESRYF